MVRPEQSNPSWGFEPPQWYGTPITENAACTATPAPPPGGGGGGGGGGEGGGDGSGPGSFPPEGGGPPLAGCCCTGGFGFGYRGLAISFSSCATRASWAAIPDLISAVFDRIWARIDCCRAMASCSRPLARIDSCRLISAWVAASASCRAMLFTNSSRSANSEKLVDPRIASISDPAPSYAAAARADSCARAAFAAAWARSAAFRASTSCPWAASSCTRAWSYCSRSRSRCRFIESSCALAASRSWWEGRAEETVPVPATSDAASSAAPRSRARGARARFVFVIAITNGLQMQPGIRPYAAPGSMSNPQTAVPRSRGLGSNLRLSSVVGTPYALHRGRRGEEADPFHR